MIKFFTLRRVTLLLALTLPSFCWGFGPAPKTALIVDDGSGFDVGTVEAFLSGRLVNAGYTVTTNTGVPGGSLAGYKQVWDIRYNFTTPLSGSDISAYVTYLAGGGALFAMGENTSFLVRDTSIVALITAAGGGVTTLGLANSQNLQTVEFPFTGPVTLPTITYAAVGGYKAIGNGRLVTVDSSGSAGAIVFPPGALSNAAPGTLISVLDVNFLTPGTGSSQPFTDNLIAYLAAPSAIPLAGSPAPSSVTLILIGLAAISAYGIHRRRTAIG
jgi:hypothetical protein